MSMIVGILENFLGTISTHYESKNQVQFDCPMCSEEKGKYGGDGKGNLAINYEKGVYKCWSCWERNNMYGGLVKLIKKYGNDQHLKDYLLIAPRTEYIKKDDFKVPDIVTLPEGFKPFSKSSNYDTGYKEAYAYIKERGLTDKMLERFNIGFTMDGKYKNRIIFPSYDLNGDVNYYVARAFLHWVSPKYLNPEAEKKLAIFNEHKINWDSTIYLVEGAFDHIVVPNSIPLLGKFISPKLLFRLLDKAKGDIVIVLDGGPEERKDSIILYKKLNTLNLYNRIKLVNLPDGCDLSLIFEESGPTMIVKFLKKTYKLMESRI